MPQDSNSNVITNLSKKIEHDNKLSQLNKIYKSSSGNNTKSVMQRSAIINDYKSSSYANQPTFGNKSINRSSAEETT